jgi:hypothetical protein
MKKRLSPTLIVCALLWTLTGILLNPALGVLRTDTFKPVSDYLKTYSNSAAPLPYDGYTLFAPNQSNITYLINNSGEIAHIWQSAHEPALSVYLLENGSLLHSSRLPIGSNPIFGFGGGAGGLVEIINWNSTVEWEFEYSSSLYHSHHDVEMMPNGNVLIIAWEYKTAEEAIDAGRDPGLLLEGELWPDHIIEVEPTSPTNGTIVWEWHVWDHLIQDFNSSKENFGSIAAHPELVDINFVQRRAKADWTHINSIDYNEEFDQIILSVHGFDEIWVIDHSTTTAEAATHSGGNSGKGGDLLYRWGNPQTYGAGDASDQKLYRQHDAQWNELGCPGEGNILIFNNGNGRPEGPYSSIDEIIPPVDENGSYSLIPSSSYGPENQTWIYTAENPTDFYHPGISGAQRLPNGNTLICHGGGTFFEVTQEKETVWEYINEFPTPATNNVFKIRRYDPNFPGLLDQLHPNDVAVTNVTTDMIIVIEGQEIDIEITVENQGSFTETFNVTIYADANQLGKTRVENLTEGSNRILNFIWNTTNFAGNYTLSVTADVVANETDILDNTFTDGVIKVNSLHDVAVVEMKISKNVVGQGHSTIINTTIKNEGIYTETFNVTLYVNATTSEIVENITLQNGFSTLLTFTWNTTNHEKGNYSITIYAHQVSGETTLINNNLTSWILVTIPGDVDGNREVNIFDIVMIAGAYSTTVGDPSYNYDYDINGDLYIDIYDVVIAAVNYAETW